MASDATHQPSTTSPSHRPAAVATTTAEDTVLDQFQQMRLMIFSFLGARQNSTPNPPSHSATISKIDHKERDFLIFRNETVKHFSGIQYKAKNARDRSQQLSRLKLQLFNFQRSHRPLQDVNTSSQFRILNKFPRQLCSQVRQQYHNLQQ